jgi:cytochrome c biogenesis protein CcmG, thiol:disulfide interchange protein DsbE
MASEETLAPTPHGKLQRETRAGSLPHASFAGQHRRVSANNVLKAAIVVMTLAFLGVIGWNLRDKSVREGDLAPQFSLKTDQGREATPTNFGGKVLVLNFWATWCPPCIAETPSLNQFERKFRDKGVVVLGVSVDKNPKKYRRFLDHFRLTFDTYRDPDATISAEYGTFQYPETFVIKDGRIMRKYISEQNWMSDEIGQYIQSLL